MKTYQANELWMDDLPDTSCHAFTSGGIQYVAVNFIWRYPTHETVIKNEFVFTTKEQINALIKTLQDARELV
jgi:hypothetical protein